jgi:very-short-patch-repair endonuclease/desulfoferrodoxin (superoxide reductase-like protein)
MKYSTQTFIKEAKKVHGNKYSYKKTRFVGLHTNILVTCKIHGAWYPRAVRHLSGMQCPKCVGKYKDTASFIKELSNVHGVGKFDWSKVEYTKAENKIEVLCKTHGMWKPTAASHLRGSGCPKCSIEKQRKPIHIFLKEALKVHGVKYDYSKVEYTANKDLILIGCNIHGFWKQYVSSHLRGHGCPKCSAIRVGKKKRITHDEFLTKALKVHGTKFNLDKVKYKTSNTHVIITCNKHGDWRCTPANYLRGYGCPTCARVFDSRDSWIKKARELHGSTFSYQSFVFKDIQQSIKIRCNKHGYVFTQNLYKHLRYKFPCAKCRTEYLNSIGIGTSLLENIVRKWVSKYTTVVSNTKEIIKPYELDIWCPKEKIAIEINGLYWHSELYKSKDYHKTKYELCRDRGIRLLQFWEDAVHKRPKAVKSLILSALGKNLKIGARECQIVNVSSAETKEFLDAYHIQGNVNGKIRLGLTYKDKLVCLAVFGANRFGEGLELLRFVSKYGYFVSGGFARLLSKIDIRPIVTYCNLDISVGTMYENAGFVLDGKTKVGYRWFGHGKILSRYQCQPTRLKSLLPKYNQSLTEVQNMHNAGYVRLFDSGNLRYILK